MNCMTAAAANSTFKEKEMANQNIRDFIIETILFDIEPEELKTRYWLTPRDLCNLNDFDLWAVYTDCIVQNC
jgi:hypothetical protein